ncbi:4-hydroxy 2-oxovalerate aldolase [Neobacillus bataviensis]|uniref:4-hydroxy 2-oxovalerate aldolase n=1 Tax=Neobacillus bataviensis TaxID=220685 RepID=A0A561D627_9BACI|nr:MULTISPECIES: aldolase catalytic domain-containing protein [Neobacillus]MCM3724904.1 aldolase catalytic domain-containing protein [Neobacillus cucumis]TWD98899.1 4-hydroxy 2-oxovalerate aldolase [Neobacillus bataviensis]
MNNIKLLDCTLRDGGYYNSWDFDVSMIQDYLKAMREISADFVELGLRGFSKDGFKGACAYTTDRFIKNLIIPEGLRLGVMVNASDLLKHPDGMDQALSKLFVPALESPVSLVRIACHVHEFEKALPAANWLKNKGYMVGFNLMQIADRSDEEIKNLALAASHYPLDVLYFADSLGSLSPDETARIIRTIREAWNGPLGIHTHDNMGYALANSIRAVEEGVTWIDGTVTGMGRGPGNAKTEYLAIELEEQRNLKINITPLMKIIESYFKPMQQKCGWGTNAFYYLSGKYGIHPTYIQEMLSDSRYIEEDILAVIDYLKSEGGKKYNINTLEAARNFYVGNPSGTWIPADEISGKEVLIIGAGPNIVKHKKALENYILTNRPYVIALNTQSSISSDLINVRAACHPVRILADSAMHSVLPQPLVIPASMLSENIITAFQGKQLLDFGISIQENTFRFESNHCVLPNSLVFSYALAIATSGKASRILLAGFDGYGADDPRTSEVNKLLLNFTSVPNTPALISITPTQYDIRTSSVYAY